MKGQSREHNTGGNVKQCISSNIKKNIFFLPENHFYFNTNWLYSKSVLKESFVLFNFRVKGLLKQGKPKAAGILILKSH